MQSFAQISTRMHSTATSEVEVRCKFYMERGFYTCFVSVPAMTERCHIKSFIGQHEMGKSNNDVKVLELKDAALQYIPSGLHNIFPKLMILYVFDCRLREIAQTDLLGLENLKGLAFSNNQLTLLPDDLLVNMKQLRLFSISKNPLGFVSSKLLDSIPDEQWMILKFQDNATIDVIYDPYHEEKGLKSVQKLKKHIDANCFPPQFQAFMKSADTFSNYKKLWELKNYSDFIIIVGTKEFQIHKNVLAAQSPVFASMLENDELVTALNKLEIKNCSHSVVEAFLRYIYTGEVKITENFLDLFSVARTFNAKGLESILEKVVLGRLDINNAVSVLTIGNLQNNESIIEAAFKKIKENHPTAIKSDALKYKPERVEEILGKLNRCQEAIKKLNEVEDAAKE